MESHSLLEAGTLAASGGGSVDQDGAVVIKDGGASPQESMMLPTSGLIAAMERDAEEAGLGGWFNRNLEDIPESWSGANSDASASQD